MSRQTRDKMSYNRPFRQRVFSIIVHHFTLFFLINVFELKYVGGQCMFVKY